MQFSVFNGEVGAVGGEEARDRRRSFLVGVLGKDSKIKRFAKALKLNFTHVSKSHEDFSKALDIL